MKPAASLSLNGPISTHPPVPEDFIYEEFQPSPATSTAISATFPDLAEIYLPTNRCLPVCGGCLDRVLPSLPPRMAARFTYPRLYLSHVITFEDVPLHRFSEESSPIPPSLSRLTLSFRENVVVVVPSSTGFHLNCSLSSKIVGRNNS